MTKITYIVRLKGIEQELTIETNNQAIEDIKNILNAEGNKLVSIGTDLLIKASDVQMIRKKTWE